VAPAARLAALVQVTVCPEALQVQPVPLAAPYVKPPGKTSETVMVPEVGALPVLLTPSVYVPVWPATKLPACDFTIARTGLPESVVGSVAVGAFVAAPPLAVAEFVTDPAGPAALTVRVIGLPDAPAAMAVVLVQVALRAEPLQVQPVPVAALNVKPVGSASVTVTVPVVGDVPVLLTPIAYVPVAPIVKLPVWLLAMASTGARTAVGLVAVGEFVAPPPLAVAVFVTCGAAAASTFTVNAIGFPAVPAAIGVALVHVTVCPAALHVQPLPVAASNDSPAGNVSVTVMVPNVATLPELLTASAYVPGDPVANAPLCDLAIASTGVPASVVGSAAVAELVAPPPLTVTAFVTDPGAPTALTDNVMGLPFAPAAMAVVLVQVAVCAEPLQVQPVPVAASNVKPAGSVSVTVIAPVVADVPPLLTAITYVPVAPIVKLPEWLFAIASTGLTTVVGSVAVGKFVAPPPLAVAEFVTVAVAIAATFTISAIGVPAAPAAIAVALVHVTVCPAALHVHPVPFAALNVSPAGSVSVTVTVPDVATFPELPIAIVYVPLWPAPNDPMCDLAIASTGVPASVVGSVAVGMLVAPPPLAVTELVTDPGAPAVLTVNAMGLPVAPAAMVVVLVHVAL
jgi:hypothetical protein